MRKCHEQLFKPKKENDYPMKKLIAGNWKMNGLTQDARALIADIVNKLEAQQHLIKTCEFLVCPPALHISAVRHALYGYGHISFGAQDCASQENGAYTGDLSAQMLKDVGCSYVIVGHSERREYHNESDALVAEKAKRALSHDLKPIICVGETLEQRESGAAEAVVGAQLKGSIPALGEFDEITIAYEPVWAIGTGKTPTLDDIAQMHGFIRAALKPLCPSPEKVRILYGGSLKPENAKEILAIENVDGGLIGGASLKADSFISIAKAV